MNVKKHSFDEIEDLKREWTEKWVEVDVSRSELKRFASRPGRVITVNMSGRALVQFEEGDGYGWGRYDIALPFLKQVEKPAPVVKAKEEKHAAAEKPKVESAVTTGESKPAAKMSPIELMRAKAAAKAAGAGELVKSDASAPAAESKPAGKISPIEIMRAKAAAKAAAGGESAPPETAPAAESKPTGKMSPLEMIRAKAAAKAAEGGDAAPTASDAPPTAPVNADDAKPAGKMSPLEMIRAKAAAKKAAEEGKSE